MSGEQMAILDENMVSSLRNDVKMIMREVILEVLPDIMRSELPKMLVDISERTKQIEQAKLDAKYFMDNNSVKFNEGYRKRVDLYKGYARCEHLTKLYNECLQANPIYIPRKFRDDNFYVRDEEELEILKGRFLGKFQCEYKLLKKRQRDFATAVDTEDDIIYNFIEHCNVPDMVKTEIGAIWERDVKANEDKVKKEWAANIEGMKTAYEKDKQVLLELNQRRARKFQQLRQSTRTVDVSTNPVVEASTGQVGEQLQESAQTISVTNDRNDLIISVINGHPNGEETSTEILENPDDTPPGVVPTSTAQRGNDPVPSEPGNENGDDDVTIESSTEENINSSAALFDNTPETNEFSTQDQNNIDNMAGNFSGPPHSQQKRPQCNYKFRKRQPLSY